MNLPKMLEKCRREQWTVGELDLGRPPRPMPREEEEATVQYFVDMAGIERLAGALFEEQRRKTGDPVLREIFASFVVDEIRHSHAAQMLADHYDVHKYRIYQPNPNLVKFTPAFVRLVRMLSAEIANVYITTGEIILDVALLRSIADKVDDETVHAAMEKINRDESRHIAIDFHMVEYYASDEWQAHVAAQPPQPLADQIRAWIAMARVFRHARPFFRSVFFAPMERCDPTGRRIREAFKRVQLLGTKPRVAERPFVKFMLAVRAAYESPLGRVVGPVCIRITGIDPQVLRTLYDEDEARHARSATYEKLAEETLGLKYG